MEISYNKMSIFKNSSMMYLTFGFILLIIFFIRIFIKPSPRASRIFKRIGQVITGLMIIAFVYHGVGLGFRWYISGHAPWSNGYEAVIFIAWVTMIAGFAFSRKNPVIIAGTAILAAMMIFVTEMNLLDPEITPLQPVLKSYWLMIHVAIITGSYGFLGLGAILSLVNLKLYIFRTQKNGKIVTLNINELTYVSEMTITIGLFMLTIGTFLGGIWANESWGRYWGWDPKETWALVSVLVYAVILHLRYIPALRSKFVFNVVSLWGYSAILFTFFGVNFYLVGLHSYAQGEGLGRIPPDIIATVVIFVLFTVFAAIRNKQYANKVSELE
jgi:cytochrome c-type biogenesis protein CcsB